MATMGRVPGAVEVTVQVAWPSAMTPAPHGRGFVPNWNDTVPVGVPDPDTVAVKVTGEPTSLGLADEVIVVVETCRDDVPGDDAAAGPAVTEETATPSEPTSSAATARMADPRLDGPTCGDGATVPSIALVPVFIRAAAGARSWPKIPTGISG
jgi:hypothetical protein